MHLRRVCILLLLDEMCLYMSARSVFPSVWFKSSVSLLLFLSGITWVWSPLLRLYLLDESAPLYFDLLYLSCSFLDWSLSIMSDISIYLHFPLVFIFMEHLLPFLHFELMYVLQVWVSCRHHKVGSNFFIHPATLCLSIGKFNPLTFRVIIDT